MNWWNVLRGKVKLREPLKNHTTLKIGGPAKFFFEPKDIDDLKLLLDLIKKHKEPLLVMGAGSNVLISDKGIDGAVLRLSSPCFKKIIKKGNYLQIGSGALLGSVVRLAASESLSGAEFLAGIPGTVGGAAVMNAGLPGRTIGDLIKEVAVMDYNGNIKTLDKDEIGFGYRTSGLSGYIVLSVQVNLRKGNKKEIRDRIKRYLDYRRATHDLSWPSAGCVFRNPEGISAGRLIDLCNLKGKRSGGAAISSRHANFILNFNNARAEDVLQLMLLVRKKVKSKFNVTLKPEIKIWQ